MIDIALAQDQLLLLFEQHLYVIAEPFRGGDLPPIKGTYIETCMDFMGDINGHFVMLFPDNKSKEIIGNFLGLMPDDPVLLEMSNFDAASEVMNILGAHILSSWSDKIQKFTIGLPKSSLFKVESQGIFLRDGIITGILIDDEPVFLKIYLK